MICFIAKDQQPQEHNDDDANYVRQLSLACSYRYCVAQVNVALEICHEQAASQVNTANDRD